MFQWESAILAFVAVISLVRVPVVALEVGGNVVEVDFYRAMRSIDVGKHTLENNDIASLVGVLKYIHTEVIAEHMVSPPSRPARKYAIDVIAKAKFSVRNPSSLLSLSSGLGQHVDFGPYVTFDSGVATNRNQQDFIMRYGGFVGVQNQRDVRYQYEDPYYWFSLNGFCPNLPWSEKGNLLSPNPRCLKDNQGGLVAGGICVNGSESELLPTGSANCTYTYGNISSISIDELAGITRENCGGRRCRDWADFRSNCGDSTYRRVFQVGTGNITSYEYCVEYDINPACAASCQAPACLALPEELRELGLPFWRGRCSSTLNAQRAEQLAAAFGIAGAIGRHELADPAGISTEPCAYNGGMCNPSPAAGGMYCSRAWAGVCQPCWIPGAELDYPASDQAYCPYDVLSSVDYRRLAQLQPRCKTTCARDLCCLYLAPSTCANATMPAKWPLDEDGFALAAAQQNTTAMAAFLTRVAVEKLGGVVTDVAGLESLAYWEWGLSPKRGRTLEAVQADMEPYLAFPTTTTTSITSSTTTPPVMPSTSFHLPTLDPTESSGAVIIKSPHALMLASVALALAQLR